MGEVLTSGLVGTGCEPMSRTLSWGWGGGMVVCFIGSYLCIITYINCRLSPHS